MLEPVVPLTDRSPPSADDIEQPKSDHSKNRLTSEPFTSFPSESPLPSETPLPTESASPLTEKNPPSVDNTLQKTSSLSSLLVYPKPQKKPQQTPKCARVLTSAESLAYLQEKERKKKEEKELKEL